MCKGLATLPATCLKSAKDIKHKISFLLQKPSEPPAADEKAAATATRAPPAAEVEKWKESFNHVMNTEVGRAVFAGFLRSEFSEENMDFWVDCEDFKKTQPHELESRAKHIYQQYVAPDSPNEVNLDAATREKTRRSVESGCPRCFDEAQGKIYLLMERDSYRRFLKSKLIQELTDANAPEKKNSDKQASVGGTRGTG